MSNVINMVEYQNRGIIEVCEEIIERAKRGEVTGLIFALREDDKNHGIGAAGDYRTNPLEGCLVSGAMYSMFARMAGVEFKTEEF